MLEAINNYFDCTGGVYDRKSELSSLAFRHVKVLKEKIIPFFLEYPLVGSKHLEFERWCQLVEIYANKEHVGKTLEAKNAFLKFLLIVKELNSKHNNVKKLKKIETITNWLKSLEKAPTKEEKLKLKEMLNSLSYSSKNNDDENLI